jgi:hypothetical protein
MTQTHHLQEAQDDDVHPEQEDALPTMGAAEPSTLPLNREGTLSALTQLQ